MKRHLVPISLLSNSFPRTQCQHRPPFPYSSPVKSHQTQDQHRAPPTQPSSSRRSSFPCTTSLLANAPVGRHQALVAEAELAVCLKALPDEAGHVASQWPQLGHIKHCLVSAHVGRRALQLWGSRWLGISHQVGQQACPLYYHWSRGSYISKVQKMIVQRDEEAAHLVEVLEG